MDKVKTIQPLKKGLSGEILIPGDKSVSHRSVMFAGLCDSEVKITNFLHAADCMSTVNCMRSLGVTVQEIDENTLIVKGNGLHGLKEPTTIIDAGNSGTSSDDGHIGRSKISDDFHRRCFTQPPSDGQSNKSPVTNGSKYRRPPK